MKNRSKMQAAMGRTKHTVNDVPNSPSLATASLMRLLRWEDPLVKDLRVELIEAMVVGVSRGLKVND